MAAVSLRKCMNIDGTVHSTTVELYCTYFYTYARNTENINMYTVELYSTAVTTGYSHIVDTVL